MLRLCGADHSLPVLLAAAHVRCNRTLPSIFTSHKQTVPLSSIKCDTTADESTRLLERTGGTCSRARYMTRKDWDDYTRNACSGFLATADRLVKHGKHLPTLGSPSLSTEMGPDEEEHYPIEIARFSVSDSDNTSSTKSRYSVL